MTAAIRPLGSLAEVDEAYGLESRCYPPELAATREAFVYRFGAFPELFLGAWDEGRLIGLACGVRTDAGDCSDVGIKKMHGGRTEGRKLCVLSVAVDPARRGSGVGGELVRAIVGQAEQAGLDAVMLMCQPHLVAWYGSLGFAATGLVHDEHGGAEWHDMELKLGARTGSA